MHTNTQEVSKEQCRGNDGNDYLFLIVVRCRLEVDDQAIARHNERIGRPRAFTKPLKQFAERRFGSIGAMGGRVRRGARDGGIAIDLNEVLGLCRLALAIKLQDQECYRLAKGQSVPLARGRIVRVWRLDHGRDIGGHRHRSSRCGTGGRCAVA
jgi:hypothetical protein